MTTKTKVEQTLRKFPFVMWDRWVPLTKTSLEVYGWIKREDAYKDFVLLFFWPDGTINYSTSSSKYTLEIYKILTDGEGRGHKKCKRVEDYFNVKNSIRLHP